MDASERNRSIIDEAPTSSVRPTLGPNNEGLQPRYATDRSPGVAELRSVAASLMDEIQEELPIRRDVAFVFVNPTLYPCSVVEFVQACVPPDHVVPLRRSSPQNHSGGYTSCGDYEQFSHGVEPSVVTDVAGDHVSKSQESTGSDFGAPHCSLLTDSIKWLFEQPSGFEHEVQDRYRVA